MTGRKEQEGGMSVGEEGKFRHDDENRRDVFDVLCRLVGRSSQVHKEDYHHTHTFRLFGCVKSYIRLEHIVCIWHHIWTISLVSITRSRTTTTIAPDISWAHNFRVWLCLVSLLLRLFLLVCLLSAGLCCVLFLNVASLIFVFLRENRSWLLGFTVYIIYLYMWIVYLVSALALSCLPNFWVW